MNRLIFSLFRLCTLALASFFSLSTAIAQEANVLGLPAIPQPKPGTATSTAKSASAPKTSSDTNANPSRDILAGELGLQHSALNGLGRLIMTTRGTFTTAGAQSSALDAARSVQRDLAKACGKQCQPEKMAAPKILPGGQLEFELAFRPLYQHLSQAQFLAALQSKPLNLTPAQLSAPATASAPSISVLTSTTTATK
jgi:hypothetical protein